MVLPNNYCFIITRPFPKLLSQTQFPSDTQPFLLSLKWQIHGFLSRVSMESSSLRSTHSLLCSLSSLLSQQMLPFSKWLSVTTVINSQATSLNYITFFFFLFSTRYYLLVFVVVVVLVYCLFHKNVSPFKPVSLSNLLTCFIPNTWNSTQ